MSPNGKTFHQKYAPHIIGTLLLFVFILPGTALTWAASMHQSYTSYMTANIRNDSLHVALKYDITDLERVFKLDSDGNTAVDQAEMEAGMPLIFDFLTEHITIRFDYLAARMRPGKSEIVEDDLGNEFIVFHFIAKVADNAGTIGIRVNHFQVFGEFFKTLGVLQTPGASEQMIFTDATPAAQFSLRQGGTPVFKQLYAFVLLGIEHIFIGVDHIMFLIGLLLPGGRFMNAIKIVTAFTVSHSITLLLAAFQLVQIPGWIIESGIALSIIYIAIENIYQQKATNRWLSAGAFGLIHGFGFANVLGALGIPAHSTTASLFSFNVGVEIGQIAIVALILPVITLMAKTQYMKHFVWAGSAIIFIFGATWFLDRAFDIPIALL